jgi:hypothetical protein
MFDVRVFGERTMPRLRRLIIAAAAVFTAGALPVAAAGTFLVQTDNWFVVSLTNSCFAANRPPNDYNQSPYNSLAIHAPKDGGFLFEVAFWPKSFEAGRAYRLSLRVEGGNSHEIDADAVSDYALKSRSTAADAFLKELQTAKALGARAQDVPVVLGFDTTRMTDVLAHLDNCRRVIRQN